MDPIVSVETLALSRMHDRLEQWYTARYRTIKADCCLIVVRTESGRSGVGEASAYGNPTQIQTEVAALTGWLIGRDPSQSFRFHPTGRRISFDCAVAGIDTALWDLRGQAAGLPVARLINEAAVLNVQVYASGGCRYDWRTDPEQLIAEALEYQTRGFPAFKFRLGTDWDWDGVTCDQFIELASAVVHATDSRFGLMVDGNARLSEAQALTIGKALARLGKFGWFEEPIPKDDLAGYQRLSRALDVPISGGESWSTVEQAMPYLRSHALSIVQPDAGLCGITEAVQMGEIASHFGIQTVPHNWHNGVMTMANAQVVASLDKTPWVELNMLQGPLQSGILDNGLPIASGTLDISNCHGLGIQIRDGVQKLYPWIEGHYGIVVERSPQE